MASKNSMAGVVLLLLLIAAAVLAFVFRVYIMNIVSGNTGQESSLVLDGNFTVQGMHIDNETGFAYLAETPRQQTEGYMNVTSTGDCNGSSPCFGMLFTNFTNNTDVCFWMKNTEIPLKQAWIAGGVVTYIYNAIPYSTNVICHSGGYVLETSPNQKLSVGSAIGFSACSLPNGAPC